VAVVHDNLPEIQNGRAPVAIVYQKGGYALHMLRGVIGSDKFWAGLREYYRRFRDSNASTGDFRHVMEEAAGQDLSWFFRQWLYQAGSPVVRGTWSYDAAAGEISVELEQTQSGEVFRLPLDVVVSVEGATSAVHRLEFSERTRKFAIKVAKAPTSVALDPDAYVLMDATFTQR
jgi:aminopeptidase N